MVDIVDIVRVSLVVANTSLFGYLILTGLRERSANRGPGVRLMRRAALAAYGAVFVGGLQRIILQGVPLGLVNDDALDPILETYAYVQAAVVLSLGVVCWRSLTMATHRLRASDDLLAAFGGALPDVDWSGVHLTPREREVADVWETTALPE